jgi:hypothetical protein
MGNDSRSWLRRWLLRPFALLALVATPGWAQDAAVHVPTARGTTLTGMEMALPNSLSGKIGVLVVGFSHASGEQVANWGRLIEADYGKSPGLVYFEMPMIGSAPKMLRGMIVKSMASGVPAAERSHFVPLTEDDKPWRTVAHYDKADDAYLLVVDGNGVVLWQTQGDATDAAYAAFKKTMNGLVAAGAH